MGKKVVIFFIAGLMIAGFVFSQASQNCTISGVVRTPEGDNLRGVIVLLRSPSLDLPEIEAVTNASGMYGFPCLSHGTYELTFIFSGLQHVVQSGIVVSAGESILLNTDLPLRAKDETVVVEGDFPKERNQRITIHEIRLSLYYRGLFTLVLRSLFNQPNSLPL
jgi:hypothetical protein